MRENFSYTTAADLLHAIELVPVWTASLFKRWTDDTTPRTDRPVRFNRGLHQYESLQYGQLRATFRFSPSFIAR